MSKCTLTMNTSQKDVPDAQDVAGFCCISEQYVSSSRGEVDAPATYQREVMAIRSVDINGVVAGVSSV